MKNRSIRFRLTVWYSLALAAGLVAFALAIWFSMQRSLSAEIDRTLALRAAGLGRFLEQEIIKAPKHVREELKEYAGGLPAGTATRIRDSQGNVLLASLPDYPFAPEWKGHRYRMLVSHVRRGGELFEIAVAEPLDDEESLLNRLRWLMSLCIPPVILTAALGGNWLSRRALRPVGEITDAARSVGIANLSERLEVPRTGDELQRLAETWNGMLARLEAAVKRLSRFTADASHELRTPLAVIRTTAEIAARRARTPEGYREALTQIVAESQRMTTLVEDLLFLARCDSESAEMPMEPLDLGSVVEEACCHARSLAEARGVVIETEGRPTGAVLGNCPAIRRLLLVLLDNAIKYSPEGGAVRVTLLDEKVEIADRGIGIPETEMPHIFERFYRASDTTSGYGIGLSLAEAIAKRHGARIEVTSALDQGSTFRLIFARA